MTKGWDHDPPAQAKLVPFGILMVASGALMLLFGSRETSDAWVDALQLWWRHVRDGLGHIRRLVIYLDNGPKSVRPADAVPEADGAVRRLVGPGGPPGVLSRRTTASTTGSSGAGRRWRRSGTGCC